MEETKGRVILTTEEYANLVRRSHELRILRELIYKTATLNYKKYVINVDSDAVSAFLKATDAGGFYDIYFDLVDNKKKEEEKGA